MIVPVEEYRQALDAMYAAAMTPARDYELVASDGVVQLTAGVCEHYDYIRLSRKRLDEAPCKCAVHPRVIVHKPHCHQLLFTIPSLWHTAG